MVLEGLNILYACKLIVGELTEAELLTILDKALANEVEMFLK